MSVRNILPKTGRARPPEVPPLYNGDRLTQREFHRRYEAMPEDCKAELIGGVVYMASPLRRPHAKAHVQLSGALIAYCAETPGIEPLDNPTVVLGEANEPQPDLLLRVEAEFGGRTHLDDDEYVIGPPELIIEVAHATESVDLHAKKDDYGSAGVDEYLVLCIRQKKLLAFDLSGAKELRTDADGVYRSRRFPGLWLDPAAAMAGDSAKLLAVVRAGLASPEHAEFVKKLKRARSK